MRVMVVGNSIQRLLRCLLDPLWRAEIHIALTKIDTVRGEIGSTVVGLSCE
jgi:hypothetical protein